MTGASPLRPMLPADEAFLRRLYARSARRKSPRPLDAACADAFLRRQFDAQDAHYQQHYPGELRCLEDDGVRVGASTWRAGDEIR